MGETDWGGNWVLFWWVGAMLSKFLIQFSGDGRGCVPSLLFDLRPNYGGGNEDNGYCACTVGPVHALPHSLPPTLQQGTADPCLCWKFWVSLLWGRCSFLPGSGVHKVLFVPSSSLFPQSCGSSGRVNGDLLQKGLCHIQVCCIQSPYPCGRPLMLKLKLQYFGHLMWRTDSLEKTLMLGKIEGGGEGDYRGWDGWMASPTRWTWVWASSSPGVGDGQGSLVCCSPWGHKESDMTERLNWTDDHMSSCRNKDCNSCEYFFLILIMHIFVWTHLP